MKIPCAEDISIHPWSKFFIELMHMCRGYFRMAWEDIGTRNHIKAFMWLNREISDDGVFEVIFLYMRMAPTVVTNRAVDLMSVYRIGSLYGRIDNQFMVLPPRIAPMVKNIIGVVFDVWDSEVYWIGRLMLLEIRAVNIRRREYAAVIIVASKNIIMIIELDLLNKHISIIMSLE